MFVADALWPSRNTARRVAPPGPFTLEDLHNSNIQSARSYSSRTEISWSLSEEARHFELGHVLNSAITDAIEPDRVGALGCHHAGLWECNLLDNSLVWSGGTHDIFGMPRGSHVTREHALACFSEESRAALERLRHNAIRNHVGFTLDARIHAAAVGEERWIRLIAAPVIENGTAVRLHGLKLVI